MKAIWDARKKIIGIAAIAILMALMMNINSRLSEYFRLSGERDALETEVGYVRMTKVAWDTRVAFATSDLAVGGWARGDAHMILPGEKFVVPVTPVGQTPEPVILPTQTVVPVENWQSWWALFFVK